MKQFSFFLRMYKYYEEIVYCKQFFFLTVFSIHKILANRSLFDAPLWAYTIDTVKLNKLRQFAFLSNTLETLEIIVRYNPKIISLILWCTVQCRNERYVNVVFQFTKYWTFFFSMDWLLLFQPKNIFSQKSILFGRQFFLCSGLLHL